MELLLDYYLENVRVENKIRRVQGIHLNILAGLTYVASIIFMTSLLVFSFSIYLKFLFQIHGSKTIFIDFVAVIIAGLMSLFISIIASSFYRRVKRKALFDITQTDQKDDYEKELVIGYLKLNGFFSLSNVDYLILSIQTRLTQRMIHKVNKFNLTNIITVSGISFVVGTYLSNGYETMPTEDIISLLKSDFFVRTVTLCIIFVLTIVGFVFGLQKYLSLIDNDLISFNEMKREIEETNLLKILEKIRFEINYN